jgi:hypothetical protein
MPGVRPMCTPCAPHVRQAWHRWLSALQLGVLKLAGGVAEWVLRFRPPLTPTSAPLLRTPFFLPPLRNTAAKDILDRSSLRRRLTTAYGSSILRRRQHPTTMAASFDDGSVLRQRRRRQQHDKGDCGSTMTTAVCVDGRQRRIVRGQRHRPILSEDDGSGRHQ